MSVSSVCSRSQGQPSGASSRCMRPTSLVTSAPVCLPGRGVRSGSVAAADRVGTAASIHRTSRLYDVEAAAVACYLQLR